MNPEYIYMYMCIYMHAYLNLYVCIYYTDMLILYIISYIIYICMNISMLLQGG